MHVRGEGEASVDGLDGVIKRVKAGGSRLIKASEKLCCKPDQTKPNEGVGAALVGARVARHGVHGSKSWG